MNQARLPLAVPADVSAALSELGIDHRIAGDEAVAPCPNPAHDDSSPSWSCNLSTGRHYCFACSWGGGFTMLVAAVRGIRVGDADLWVRMHRVSQQDFGIAGDDVPARPKQVVSEADLWEVTDPPAGQLASRRISLEAARALEIGWHPRKECWVFPIRDPGTDRLMGWQEKSRRVFMNRPRDVEKSRAVFGMRHLKKTGSTGPVVVVESPLDVARFWTAGIKRVVSTYGISFSELQVSLLWRWCDEIIFAPDNDDAGHRKICQWLAGHPEEHWRVRVFDYESFEDKVLHACVHPKGDGRDPGNLTDRELRRGIEWATPAWNTYFEGVNWWQ